MGEANHERDFALEVCDGNIRLIADSHSGLERPSSCEWFAWRGLQQRQLEGLVRLLSFSQLRGRDLA
jgi:hypothetical protein